MTIQKLTDNIYPLNTTDKINELIDQIETIPVITVDSALNETSENPLQNAVIKTALDLKQDILTAGTNISISEGIISAIDTTYTAGNGISISDEGVISNTQTSAEWGNITGTLSEQADLTEILDLKQDLLTAGAGISISDNNVISTNNYSYYALCPAITPVNGLATWTINHNLGTRNISVALYSGGNEVGKDVEIVSDNSIRVSFVASENIAAESRSVIVLAIGGVPVSSTPSVLENSFIPAGTVIHVELDGSGDFTSLQDAVNSLQNKFSNGTVTISLGSGTFVENTINLTPALNLNIPSLIIEGVSTIATILDFSASNQKGIYIARFNSNVIIKNLYIKGTSSASNGIHVEIFPNLELQNVTIDGFQEQVKADNNALVMIGTGTFTFKNGNHALSSYRSRLITWAGDTIIFENIGTALTVEMGGILNCQSNNITYTNVTKKTNQTVGTATTNGWITGNHI